MQTAPLKCWQKSEVIELRKDEDLFTKQDYVKRVSSNRKSELRQGEFKQSGLLL